MSDCCSTSTSITDSSTTNTTADSIQYTPPIFPPTLLQHGFIDCHNHLIDEKFDGPNIREQAIINARNNNIKYMLVMSQNIIEAKANLLLQQQYHDIVRIGAGIHPVQYTFLQDDITREHAKNEMKTFIQENHEHLTCIGEVGLDFSPWLTDTSEKKQSQITLLKMFAELAQQYDLTLNVHSRSAGKPVVTTLIESKMPRNRVLLHAFDGSFKVAKLAIAQGWYFSVPTSIVRDAHSQQVFTQIPLEHLVLETDAPALHPVKGPNLRNEPSFVPLSCIKLAELKGMKSEEIAPILYQNTLQLFPRITRNFTTQ